MAGLSEIVIQAIRRIVDNRPDISSALGAPKKRGVIDGIVTTLGGDNQTGSEESCCTDPTETPEPDGPCDPSVIGSIWCKPDPEDDPWTDCETGQPVDFDPQGFPQEESCKECAPDESWEQGFYWSGSYSDACNGTISVVGATAAAAYSSAPGVICGSCAGGVCLEPITKAGYVNVSETAIFVRYLRASGNIQNYIFVTRKTCPTEGEESCEITEPPEVCGDDWQPDGSTSYTLRNGCIVASKCDTDAPSGDLGCNKCKTLCRGNDRVQICATDDGGMVITDPDGQKEGGKYNDTGVRTEILQPGQTGGYI